MLQFNHIKKPVLPTIVDEVIYQFGHRGYNCYGTGSYKIGDRINSFTSHGLADSLCQELKLDGYETKIIYKADNKLRGVVRPFIVVITGKILG